MTYSILIPNRKTSEDLIRESQLIIYFEFICEMYIKVSLVFVYDHSYTVWQMALIVKRLRRIMQ
jgi:hypothetical protein